jgi:type III pantothenate kinase
MLLVIDIGNTNITFGVYEGARLAHTFRAETAHRRTADEHAALLAQMLGLKGIARDAIDAAVLASVVPPETEKLVQAVRVVSHVESIVVGPGTRTGVPIRYDNPRDVGADRIVNAVAAYARAEGGVIVVDFGTATTFDCVSPSGEYLGGVIAPGIQVSLDALMDRAAKLKPVEIAEPPHVVGRNTVHSLQSGIVYGHAAMVEGLVARLRAELGFPCAVFATGGYATLIARHVPSIQEVDEHLTLEGLRLIYERGKAAS